MVSGTHISQFIAINLIAGIDLTDFIDFYNFKDTILKNYLTDFNEIYTHYRGGCVELVY